MATEFDELLVRATQSLCDCDPVVWAPYYREERLKVELLQLLWHRNGFFAYGGALHVFASGACPEGVATLERWNAASGWRKIYGDLAENRLFFAQDLCGGQFCLFREQVCKFDPETGESEAIAATLKDWARSITTEDRFLTGWPLLEQWEAINGPLADPDRLVPKVPFVLGGAFDVTNLYPLEASRAMEFYGDLAQQIREFPDGAEIRFQTRD